MYSQKIQDIDWSSVKSFCDEQLTENTYLDYKGDFPKNLEKTIAAMANTLGGVIIIGVAEDKQLGKPVLPVEGIDMQRGLEERITNIILTNISPPVFPEIAVCPDVDEQKAFVVIRVPQSDAAPHATHHESRVYVRTGNLNTPEELANIDKVFWLRDRREKAVALREWIFERATQRFFDMRDGSIPEISATEEGGWVNQTDQPALLTLAITPVYPNETPSVTPPELNVIRRNINVRDYMGTGHEFPLQESGCISRLVEDGLVMHYSGRGTLRTYHTHLNIHGLFLYMQSLLFEIRDPEQGENVEPFIRGYEILCRLYEILESAAKFYDQIEYSGPLYFRMRFQNILGIPLRIVEFEGNAMVNYTRYSADPQLDMSQNLTVDDLSNRKQEIVLRFAERLGWAFDWPMNLNFLLKLYGQMKKS